MKFKQITAILLLAIGLLIIGSSALAFSMPYAVWGEVTYNGKLWDGKPVKITDLVSGVSEMASSNEQGKYQFELSGINENYRPGDRYTLDACQTEENYKLFGSSCFQTITIVGEGGLRADIKLVDSTNTFIVYTCWDGKEVFDKTNCLPEPTEEEPVCTDKCDDWTKVGVGIAIAVIIALIGIIGGGIKIYRNRLGTAVFQHFHKGITIYHDPNVRHANVLYRHRLWKDDPIGCMDDVKKINGL